MQKRWTLICFNVAATLALAAFLQQFTVRVVVPQIVGLCTVPSFSNKDIERFQMKAGPPVKPQGL